MKILYTIFIQLLTHAFVCGVSALQKAVFEVGDKVRHKVFGTGEIVKVDKVTQTYEIQFENIRGTRRLMFRAELGNVEN